MLRHVASRVLPDGAVLADHLRQQERAEWIGSMTVALIGSVNAAMAAGDPASVEANRDYLRERVDDFDLFRTDLTQIRLTKRGIARR